MLIFSTTLNANQSSRETFCSQELYTWMQLLSNCIFLLSFFHRAVAALLNSATLAVCTLHHQHTASRSEDTELFVLVPPCCCFLDGFRDHNTLLPLSRQLCVTNHLKPSRAMLHFQILALKLNARQPFKSLHEEEPMKRAAHTSIA